MHISRHPAWSSTPGRPRTLGRSAALSLHGAAVIIVLHHFSLLRQRVGVSTESVLTSAKDLAALWEETRSRLDLPFDRTAFRAACNDEFAPWDTLLRDGDHVAFLPPVSGG